MRSSLCQASDEAARLQIIEIAGQPPVTRPERSSGATRGVTSPTPNEHNAPTLAVVAHASTARRRARSLFARLSDLAGSGAP